MAICYSRNLAQRNSLRVSILRNGTRQEFRVHVSELAKSCESNGASKTSRHEFCYEFSSGSGPALRVLEQCTALLSRKAVLYDLNLPLVLSRACPGRGYKWQLPNPPRTFLFFPESPPAIPGKILVSFLVRCSRHLSIRTGTSPAEAWRGKAAPSPSTE